MALESDNVRVGVTGAIYVAPLGTTLPTTSQAALNVAFQDLGYMDESGVAELINEQITNLKAWQNSDVVRKVQTEHDYTLGFVPMETNAVVLGTFYDNYDGSGADGIVNIEGGLPTHKAFVFDIIDGDDEHRIVVQDGQLTTRGQVNHVATDATKYPMTVTCFPAMGSGAVKAIHYHRSVGAS